MRVLDLFCGAAGGWSKGLERAGYATVAACEIDPWRRAVFAASHPGCVMYADVRELTADRLRADLGYLPEVIVGSPPCQEISAANTKGKGITDDHLFWEWARLVFEVRPLWCAAENSPRARTEGIDGILDALDQAGYAAWPCVVGADSAGANHRRKRLWLIAADATRIGRGGWWPEERRPQERNLHDVGLVSGDDPHADGPFSGRTGRHADGRLAMGAGADGEPHSDAQGIGQPRPMGCATRRAEERHRPAGHALPDAPHSDCEGLPLGPRVLDHHGEKLPPALRDIGLAWPHWNGGIAGLAASCAAAGFGVLDDGPITILPAGLRNRAIAALGDAVITQIPEAIGRAMTQFLDTIKKEA